MIAFNADLQPDLQSQKFSITGLSKTAARIQSRVTIGDLALQRPPHQSAACRMHLHFFLPPEGYPGQKYYLYKILIGKLIYERCLRGVNNLIALMYELQKSHLGLNLIICIPNRFSH